jgi:arginyl-tRNA--protein-N-Asp/Glu arginylyltransferase
MIIWILGMHSPFKRQLAQAMFKILKTRSQNWMLLDGDMVRDVFGDDVKCITDFCKYSAVNGLNVLICVISIFPEMQKINRDTIPGYCEIYVEDNNNPDFVKMAFAYIKQLNIPLNESYEYACGNKLKTIQKYEFTNYESDFFFRLYNRNRADTMNALLKNMNKAAIKVPIDSKFIIEQIERCSGKNQNNNTINTTELLSDLLLKYEQSIAAREDEEVLMIFLKKFEVFKRLFTQYHIADGKYAKASDDYEEIINYLLLANILASAIQKSNSDEDLLLKTTMLNTLLKVNDTISSVLYLVYSPLELALAYRAFASEKEIICHYIQ